MKQIIAYCGVEPEFVNSYNFEMDRITCFDNPEHAREDIDDFLLDGDETFAGYVAQVSIVGKLFNIFDSVHRKQFLSALPPKLAHRNYIIPKEVYVLHLMSAWYSDTNDIKFAMELDYPEKYFWNEITFEFLEEHAFDGFVVKNEECSSYVVFNPNKNLKFLDITI